VSLDAIIVSMDKVNVLFFGEEHNDSIGHYLESELFKRLSIAYPAKVAASMEMFHRDIQTVMNEYLAGIISEKNFLKEARVWNNYKDYKPLVEYAKANKLAVIAANAATRYSNAVTMKGLEILKGLNKESLQFIAPLPVDTATGRYYDKFIETLGGHSMGGMKVYQTQNFWDATMAWSVAEYLKRSPKNKVIHLNGRFHTDEKLGTYAQFTRFAPKATAINISCFSAADFENPNWEKYKALGDFIIVTDPKVKRSY
ncbi:MAG: hypothetical protein EOO89_28550, partial [Pedobacter sp.]